MRQYHDQKLPAAATVASGFADQPPPVAGPPPTRFTLGRSVYERRTSPQAFTVEAEFQKYASGQMSSDQTDILRFWEVSFP